MITETKMLYLYVETPLHAGVGSGLSSIDLPIQRERTTQYPMIQGSGIKGKLRATAEDMKEREQTPFDKDDNLVAIMFGPENGSDHAGALIAGDARILLFPVRSLSSVFAYTTSYDVLSRFMRDVNRGGGPLNWILPEKKLADHIAHVTTGSAVTTSGNIVLEEFSFTAQETPMATTIANWIAMNALPDTYGYWREKLKSSLVILPDNDFRDFVLHATEIITRVQLDREKKTVKEGPWTEEHLPTDTLLYVPIYATNSRKATDKEKGEKVTSAAEILQYATSLENNQGGYIQLGGDETVGRGLVRMHWGNSKSSQSPAQK